MRSRTIAIWLFVLLLVVGGVAFMVAVEESAGVFLIIVGLFLAVLQAFDIRRARKAQRNICPRCGQMLVENSRLCTSCGFELK